MSLHIPFDNSYARLPDRFFARQGAAPATAPELLAFNAGLARELGIGFDEDPDALAAAFSGVAVYSHVVAYSRVDGCSPVRTCL